MDTKRVFSVHKIVFDKYNSKMYNLYEINTSGFERSNNMTKTINVSMSENDAREIDLFCKAHNLTRSKFLVQCALQCMYAEQTRDAVKYLGNQLMKIRLEGGLETADIKRLESMCEMLGGVYTDEQSH